MNRRYMIAAAVVAVSMRCALPVGGPAPTQTLRTVPAANAAPLTVNRDSSFDFQVQVMCSETDLRMPIALILWRGGPSARSSQRIDVTVFKEGFEREQFASVNVALGGAFIPAPGLRGMQRSGDRAMRPFELVAQLRSDPRPEEQHPAVVEVRNLEPGLLYQWRLFDRTGPGAVPSNTITVEAPVCVADEAREEE